MLCKDKCVSKKILKKYLYICSKRLKNYKSDLEDFCYEKIIFSKILIYCSVSPLHIDRLLNNLYIKLMLTKWNNNHYFLHGNV